MRKLVLSMLLGVVLLNANAIEVKCFDRRNNAIKYIDSKEYAKAYVWSIRASDVCKEALTKDEYFKLIKVSIQLEYKLLKEK